MFGKKPKRQKREASALITSLAIHLLILAALFMVQYAVVQKVEELDIQTVFDEQERRLDDFVRELEANTEVADNLATQVGDAGSQQIAGNDSLQRASDAIEDSVALATPDIHVNIGTPIPGFSELGDDLPPGEVYGDTAAVVPGYHVAMDRLAAEMRRLMRDGEKLLVVWLFDESESMQNDQKIIHDEFHKIYEELKIVTTHDKRVSKGKDVILTAVHSFGKGMSDLTGKPTADENVIKGAIDKIQIDESGEENMCSAITTVVEKYSSVASRGDRQLIVVIVTDESGDDGAGFDLMLAKVKKVSVPCYVLSRESVFGYPYARIRWKDPEFGLTHWLQVRRGPETAYPEALQYDGLHDRWDAQSAGFGPYEQARLAKETGGIFFVLPSEEENLVSIQHDEERKYRFDAMLEYAPQLTSREDYAEDRDKSKFRRTMWDVIVKLNPHLDKELQIREIWYSSDPKEFHEDAQLHFGRAVRAMGLLNEAAKSLESIEPLRDDEASLRWRANYDLLVAQVLAYRVRLFQYLLAVDKHDKEAPQPKNPKNNRWSLHRTPKMLPPDDQQVKATKVDMQELNKQLRLAEDSFRKVVHEHPGTPWAYRANYELKQGFGMEFVETFRDPRYDKVTVKLPKQ